MGVPYFKVKDIIKDNDAILFSSHFALYRDLSRRVFEVMRSELEVVQQYSIDEAFFTFTGSEAEAQMEAVRLKDIIETKLGLPVSVAFAPSKTLAKYANTVAKKTTGTKVLSLTEWSTITAKVKLSEIWGIGRQMSLRFEQHNLRTVADLLTADSSRISKLFGVNGERLRSELQGIQTTSVVTEREVQQSIMSTRSFKEVATEKAVLADAIAYHTRHIAEDLRAMEMLAVRLRISIQPSRYSDFVLQGSSEEVVLETPTNNTIELLQVAESLLEQAFKHGVPYKKAGVYVSSLIPESMAQGNLFGDKEDTAKSRLMDVLDTLNAKAGRELVSVGSRLRASVWQARKDLVSPAYTTKWTDVAKVKA